MRFYVMTCGDQFFRDGQTSAMMLRGVTETRCRNTPAHSGGEKRDSAREFPCEMNVTCFRRAGTDNRDPSKTAGF